MASVRLSRGRLPSDIVGKLWIHTNQAPQCMIILSSDGGDVGGSVVLGKQISESTSYQHTMHGTKFFMI